MGRLHRLRRMARRIWAHRWPQLCWWTRFVLGVPAVARWRQLLAWVPRGARRASQQRLPAQPEMHIVPGAIHVHTNYSDGGGSIAEVAAAAAEAGLRFVVVTDHDTLQGLADGWEGYHSGCLVLVGTEVRVHGGHVLALRVPGDFGFGIDAAGEVVERIRRLGGIPFFLPDEDLSLSPAQVRDLPFAGMEVINLHNVARQVASLPALIAFALRYLTRGPMVALRVLLARPDGDIALWDRLSRGRRVPAIASVDAHSRLRIGPKRHLGIPSYAESFRLVQTHLLLTTPLSGDLLRDRERIYAALESGRAHLVYGAGAGAAAIRFWAETRNGPASAGDAIVDDTVIAFYASCPVSRSLFRLYRNGRLIAQQAGRQACFPAAGAGSYRLEVYRWRGRAGALYFGLAPWLFTNCITVRRETGTEPHREQAAPAATCGGGARA